MTTSINFFSRLHRPRGVPPDGLLFLLRLVEPRRDHVRDADWLSSVLLRDSTRDLQEDHELEADSHLPGRGTHLGGRQGDGQKVSDV